MSRDKEKCLSQEAKIDTIVVNRKEVTFKDMYHMKTIPTKRTDKNPFRMQTCNLAFTQSILDEYSKDKYIHIGECFDAVGEDYGWPPFAYFNNWIHSGDIPELAELYGKIVRAKRDMLEYEIIKLTRDSSNDYFRDKNGDILYDDSGKPVKDDPALARLKLLVGTLNQINMQINAEYGKKAQIFEEKRNSEASATLLADALTIMAEKSSTKLRQEKDVSRETDYIDHERNEK